MPISINIPDVAWAEQTLNLGGYTYDFVYSYNSRTRRVYVDIYYSGEIVEAGIPIMESGNFFSGNRPTNFEHGDIYCVRFKADESPATLGNIGIGKNYELLYYTNSELGLDE